MIYYMRMECYYGGNQVHCLPGLLVVLCITIKQACCSKCLRIVCVKIMQEVWRCEGDNVSLHSQKDFKRLKGEDYGTNISN